MMSGNNGKIQGACDSSRMESLSADVFEVFCSAEEFALAFGTTLQVEAGPAGLLPASLTKRIILSPYTAKRLVLLLKREINAYESRFGRLDGGVPTNSVLEADACGGLFRSATGKYAEKARDIKSQIDGLGVNYFLERSFKMSDRSLLENRFLMGFNKDDLPGNTGETISSLFNSIGMPAGYIDECRKLLPDARFVHFGFEEKQDGCLCKAYLEFKKPGGPGTVCEQVTREPYLDFLGFKWDPFVRDKGAISRYTCFPSLSLEEIREKLATLFGNNSDQSSFDTARNILNHTAKSISAGNIIYEEVSEENNPRKSFDINFYDLNIPMRDIYPFLMEACRLYSLPVDTFASLYGRMGHKRFGHLSGGIDREGKDFLTVYYGVEERIGVSGL